MIQKIKLAIFDYDGTIADEVDGKIPHTVYSAINSLWESGVRTTIITTRPYQRLLTVSGGLEKLISPGLPIGVERGARVIDNKGLKNLMHIPISKEELRQLQQIELEKVIDFIGFYPTSLKGWSYIWTPDNSREKELISKFGHDGIVLVGQRRKLFSALDKANPSMVTLKFRIPTNNVALPEKLNYAIAEKSVSIISNNTDKSEAFRFILKNTSTDMNEVLFVGNDTNDLPILNLSKMGGKIIVGDTLSTVIRDAVHVSSPTELGEYLKNSNANNVRAGAIIKIMNVV